MILHFVTWKGNLELFLATMGIERIRTVIMITNAITRQLPGKTFTDTLFLEEMPLS
jgi:hypothetical protein